MKVTYAVKKLSKFGKVALDDCQYSSFVKDKEGKWHFVSFRKNGGGSDQVVCLHARRANDAPDSQSDYFPGRYFDTFSQVERYLGF